MKGVFLRFYVQEKHKHRHHLLYEWLLEQASKLGMHGGTAFRAVAGFGHHGKLHFQQFFELAGELPMQLDFVVTDAEADKLLSVIDQEGVRLFYLRIPAEFGVLNPDASDAAEFSGSRADERPERHD
jgi:PII-like signaling protein